MAFVSQAERGIQRLSFPSHLAAPGSYQLTQSIRPAPHSYAPFASTSLRTHHLKSDIPGPGAYMSVPTQWHPSLTTYSNDRNIVIKLHTIGTPSFVSKQQRFSDKVEDAPGPGEYEVVERRQRRQHSQPVRSTKVFNSQDHKPSISKTIYLSQRRVRTEEAGYPQLLEKKVHCVADWSKDKVHRFQRHQSLNLGPGTYDHTPKVVSKKGKKNPSNFFLSNTVRTFDTIVFKAQNQETLMLRQIEEYKRQQPAPGSYNIGSNKHNESEKYKNKSFGSTKKRFEKSKTEEDVTVPFYEVSKSFEPKQFHRKSVPFNSECKRMAASAEPNPGPGYYLTQQQSAKMIRRPVQNFGSSVDRTIFQSPAADARVGPGYYQTSPKKWQLQRQSTIFASKIPRPFQQQLKPDNKFATYDLSKEDIGRRVHENKVHRQNLQKIDCGKPAFDRQTPRFSHYEEGEGRPKALTRQQIENIVLEKKQAERERRLEEARGEARAGRAGALGRGGARFEGGKKGPGVGEYTIRSNWTKKSYNIKYGMEKE